MISLATGSPLDERWQPMLTMAELESANTLLKQAGCPFSWEEVTREPLTRLTRTIDVSGDQLLPQACTGAALQ